MTEEEAKTKTCHRTLALVVTVPENRTIHIDPKPCIGSACMAFRWVDKQDWETIKDAKCYCGLAGKP